MQGRARRESRGRSPLVPAAEARESRGQRPLVPAAEANHLSLFAYAEGAENFVDNVVRDVLSRDFAQRSDRTFRVHHDRVIRHARLRPK